ncbi:hypothetical protein LPA44_04445 [Halobacterium sp. KA-4]|uniref:hypothetical protein n=1 Tax=Halobacterium sp. KA-4 TaxID=2896367 RepID=UPI001E38D588|nr:hypothetical protein [Halobacterium sp. KA-4]MCD2199149.1 hypothetical protein [Halobacterium sp. KA-4]
MAVAERERELFGQELEPIDRVLAGAAVAFGALGHAALAAAGAGLAYAVLTAAL